MEEQLKDLAAIRSIMERSTRFISLSGLSGISAGIVAVIGAAVAYFAQFRFDQLYKFDLSNQMFRFFVVDALLVLIFALSFAYYFTWRRTKHNEQILWSATTKRLLFALALPLLVGGAFCILLIAHAPVLIPAASLIFYGLALLNASKYTLDDIRTLAYCEIIVGLLAGFLANIGLDFLFLGIGFGLLHIIYGTWMYNKYETIKN